ncbi:MAG: hypothetical protein QM687_15395 [Ferruginibacter sp.]
MKKIFTKFFLLAFFLFAGIAGLKAQLLTSEDFNFSGNITANGWTAHSGTTNFITTTTGLTYAGILGTGVGNAALVSNLGGEDDNITFATQNTDGQNVYVSMLVNITDPATAKTGDYFFNIGDGGGTSFTLFSARLFAKITASAVNFGISNTSTATYGTTSFAKNTTYLLVIKYTINAAGNDPVSLWVIPSGVPVTEAAAGTPEISNTATAGQDVIRGLALRQGSATTSVQTVVDAIKVGTTWADVTPSSNIPASLTVAGTISDFGSVNVGSASASQSYNLSGANLTGAPGNITVTAPADFEVSNNNTSWGSSTTIAYSAATLPATPVWVRFAPQSAGPKSGNVTNVGGGAATAVNVAVSGTGVVPVTPVISATTLAGFGNVCLNTTAGPNFFTLNGLNLTNADITVGPLTGYSFATTAAGTYTSSLTLTQAGGTFTQIVYVKFTPTATQSYDGNIAVTGGGAPAVNVAATGAGANNPPAVTTGAASAITTTTATLAGTISSTGCSAVTAYGIEYSTTNGFANGSGTQAASTNQSAGAYTSALSNLVPATTYYYKAYATNAGGTTYGAQQSFVTATPVLVVTPLTAFGAQCLNSVTGPNSFAITSTGVTAANITIGALAGYSYSTTATGTYTSTLSITHPVGALSQTIYVKFTPTAIQSYNGNIAVGGGGAPTVNVAASGSGVNAPATLTTGSASDVTTASAVLAGTISSNGCSAVTAYGIEFSGINNFANGTGTKVFSTNADASGNYSAAVSGLVQNTTYYFKAFATNGGGTAYGAIQSFTTAAIPDKLTLYNIPAQRNTALRFSVNNIKPDHYGVILINSNGQLVYRKDFIVQVNFINDQIEIPNNLTPGVYQFRLENYNGYRVKRTIMIK